MSHGYRAFVSDSSGATAIEYSLLASLAAVACIAALINFGDSMVVLYTVVDAIAGVM